MAHRKHAGPGAGGSRHGHLVWRPAFRVSGILGNPACRATYDGPRGIFVNNLAIRRATEDLKGTSDYVQVCRILHSAFSIIDFDGLRKLEVKAEAEELPTMGDKRLRRRPGESLHFEWSKPGAPKFRDGWAAWNLTLELVTTANRWRGSMKISRLYTDRALLVDTNLLTSVFPVVLADALDRALAPKEGVVPEVTASTELIAAEAS